jgi:hypothetical protein
MQSTSSECHEEQQNRLTRRAPNRRRRRHQGDNGTSSTKTLRNSHLKRRTKSSSDHQVSLNKELDQVVSHGAEHRELLHALLRGNHHLAREIAKRQVEKGRLRVFDAILQSLADGRNSSGDVALRPIRRTAEDYSLFVSDLGDLTLSHDSSHR